MKTEIYKPNAPMGTSISSPSLFLLKGDVDVAIELAARRNVRPRNSASFGDLEAPGDQLRDKKAHSNIKLWHPSNPPWSSSWLIQEGLPLRCSLPKNAESFRACADTAELKNQLTKILPLPFTQPGQTVASPSQFMKISTRPPSPTLCDLDPDQHSLRRPFSPLDEQSSPSRGCLWNSDPIEREAVRIGIAMEEIKTLEDAVLLKEHAYFFPYVRYEDSWWYRACLAEQDPGALGRIRRQTELLPDLLCWPGMKPGDTLAATPPPVIPATKQETPARYTSIKDAKEILTISYLWEYFGLPGCAGRSCRSPFRDERNPSFSVYQDKNGAERFKDHGDPDTCGDSYDFYQQCTGLNSQEAFIPFLELAEKVRLGGTQSSSCRERAGSPGPKPLPPEFPGKVKSVSAALKNNLERCVAVANVRKWKVETLERLAEEGSLGWHSQGLAFIYSTGIKARTWLSGPGRKVWWVIGGPSIWRADKMVQARKVFVCEGETDCISLLDAGLEEDPEVAVVAVPSASTFNPDWAPLFAAKDVTLCMDNDSAGRAAELKIGALILPFVASLSKFNVGSIDERH